jgi:hypothetical protein
MIVLFAVLSGSARAGFPLGWPGLYEKESMASFSIKPVMKNKINFVPLGYNKSSMLNGSFATGRQRKMHVKGLESLLYWDLKLKVKLNRNMTIIFSYN